MIEQQNHEYYVDVEIAKLLKESGFDWEVCDGYVIYEDGDGFTTGFQIPYNFNGDNGDLFIDYRRHTEVFSKPTLDIAQRWLREVKGLFICVMPEIKDYHATWNFYICNEQGLFYENEVCFLTYEEAQESGIKKALEIILEL